MLKALGWISKGRCSGETEREGERHVLMRYSKANAYLIWHPALLANDLIGHKWIISALRNFPPVQLKRKRLKNLCLFTELCPLFSYCSCNILSPALLISDYSRFMFPCISCFWYSEIPHNAPYHRAGFQLIQPKGCLQSSVALLQMSKQIPQRCTAQQCVFVWNTCPGWRRELRGTRTSVASLHHHGRNESTFSGVELVEELFYPACPQWCKCSYRVISASFNTAPGWDKQITIFSLFIAS